MKTIFALMRADMIALKGGQKKFILKFLIPFVIFALIGIFIMPVGFALCGFIFSLLIVPMITEQEIKGDYSKMFCILPADRKRIVSARFLLIISAFTFLSLILFILMQFSEIADLYHESGDIDDIFDIFGIGMSPAGFRNVFFAAAFMTGLTAMSKKMRDYFRYGAASGNSSAIKRVLKAVLIYLAFIVISEVIIYASRIPFIQSIFSLLFGIIDTLSQPMNGFLLNLTFIVIGYGMSVYQTVCAMIEYEEREL